MSKAKPSSMPPSPGHTVEEKLHEHEKEILRLQLMVSLLGDMVDELSESIGNLYALVEKLHPPEGPIVPYQKIKSLSERLPPAP